MQTHWTPFWTSTPQAKRRTAQQAPLRRREHRARSRAKALMDAAFIQIPVPRGLTLKKQVSLIKRKCPYKLRRSELKGLQGFLASHLHLDVIVLPKQRTHNQPIDFTDSRVMLVDDPS